MRRIGLWRALGRPEARLHGHPVPRERRRRAAEAVTSSPEQPRPWLLEGTGLDDGATFGEFVGGFGTEIDATPPDSPPGTTVLAEIPNLFGRG